MSKISDIPTSAGTFYIPTSWKQKYTSSADALTSPSASPLAAATALIRTFQKPKPANDMSIRAKLLILWAIYCCAGVFTVYIKAQKTTDMESAEPNRPVPGMFFSSESVVEEYEYDDAYVLLYTDADANLNDVEICVDLETYQMVIDAVKNGNELVGSLILNDDYSFDGVEVYTYVPEPEYEMALASSKL